MTMNSIYYILTVQHMLFYTSYQALNSCQNPMRKALLFVFYEGRNYSTEGQESDRVTQL